MSKSLRKRAAMDEPALSGYGTEPDRLPSDTLTVEYLAENTLASLFGEYLATEYSRITDTSLSIGVRGIFMIPICLVRCHELQGRGMRGLNIVELLTLGNLLSLRTSDIVTFYGINTTHNGQNGTVVPYIVRCKIGNEVRKVFGLWQLGNLGNFLVPATNAQDPLVQV
jgi:hypothetical protein